VEGSLPKTSGVKGAILKKLLATAVAAAMLAAVPALAQEGNHGDHAVTDEFLTIGGPKRLEARAKLRVPIRCSEACDTTATTKLTIPGSTIPPDTAQGHLAPNEPKNLIVNLNKAASDSIKKYPNASRLRVSVTAKSSITGQRVEAAKVFKFKKS
jgi:hypothetical protein